MTPCDTFRSSSLLRGATILLTLCTLAACSEQQPTASVPSPAEETTDVVATASSLDAEAARADGRGDTERATAFREAAAGLRLGVRPTTIALSVRGETYRFAAVVTANLEVLADGDTALRRTLVAWRGDRAPVEILRVITLGNQGTFSSEDEPAGSVRARAHGLLVNLERESRWLATAGTAGIAVGDSGGACEPLTRADATFRCVRAVFGVNIDALFRLNGSGPDDGQPAVRVMASTQRVAGVILGSPRNP